MMPKPSASEDDPREAGRVVPNAPREAKDGWRTVGCLGPARSGSAPCLWSPAFGNLKP